MKISGRLRSCELELNKWKRQWGEWRKYCYVGDDDVGDGGLWKCYYQCRQSWLLMHSELPTSGLHTSRQFWGWQCKASLLMMMMMLMMLILLPLPFTDTRPNCNLFRTPPPSLAPHPLFHRQMVPRCTHHQGPKGFSLTVNDLSSNTNTYLHTEANTNRYVAHKYKHVFCTQMQMQICILRTNTNATFK